MSDWIDAERSVEQAHECYERGRWAEAESFLRRAIAVNPYQAEWHFNLGLTLEAAGRYDEAAAAFSDAAELEPAEGAAMLSVAANLVRADRSREALEAIDTAERAGADPVQVAIRRVEALSDLQRYDDAETAFYMGVQHADDDADLFATMGDSLLDRGEHDRALACFRAAAKLNPELEDIDVRLAEVFEASGRLERARQMYMRRLRTSPGDVDTLLDLARLLDRMHRGVEAAEKLRRAIELDPRCAEAHAMLSDLAPDDETAIAEMDIAVRLDPEVREGRRQLARMLLARRGVDDARRVRELLDDELRDARKTRDADALRDLADLCLDAGRPHDAVVVTMKLRREEPDDTRAAHLHSVALLESGRVEEGMAVARAIVRDDPTYVAAMHNLALAHLRRREWIRARYWVNQARQIDPEDGSIRLLRARLWYHAWSGLARSLVSGAWRAATVMFTRPTRRPR